MKKRTAAHWVSLVVLCGLWGCDDESDAGGPDCRQEAYRCIDSLTCVESGAEWVCLPVRDARVDDATPPGDSEVMIDSDAMVEPTPDAAPDPVDMAAPADARVDATSVADAAPEPDAVIPEPDAAPELDAAPEPDAAPRPEDMGVVEPEDMGVVEPEDMDVVGPEDMGVVEPEDMGVVEPMDMGGMEMFGPGRCNHQRRLDRDDQYEPNPDQNSARPIELGRHEGLVLRGDDSDWYRVRGVCAGGFIEISLDHPFDGGDVDLQVWAGGGRVIHSQGLCTGHEEGRYQIEDGIEQVIIGVYPFGPPGQPGGDNTYDLEIAMACP